MVSSKSSKVFHFVIFLLPAFLLYFMFFIKPLYKGVGYSFTDWNGVVPEVKLEFEKTDFEKNILGKLKKSSDKEYLKKYYIIDEYNEYYELSTYIQIPNSEEERAISPKEKAKLKKILKKAGSSPIKFIGFKNYIDMFKNDERFVPRINKNKLFKKYKSLPKSIDPKQFEKNLMKNIKNNDEKDFVKKYYKLSHIDKSYFVYFLNKNIEKSNLKKLKLIMDVRLSKIEKKKLKSKFKKNSLFSKVPEFVDQKNYETYFIGKINDEEKKIVSNLYKRKEFIKSEKAYVLQKITKKDQDKLKLILSENMYKKVFVMGVIGFTLFFTFFNVIFSNVVALALALALDLKLKTRNMLRAIFFLPNVLSLIIVAFVWSFVFRLILPLITGIDVWLGSVNLAPYAVIMVSVWQSCGYLMIIYLAGLQTIPQSILESAQIDGAIGFNKFRYITLPLLVPAVTICTFYSIANSLKTFDIIFALTSGGPGYATTPIVLDIYFNAFLQNKFGYGTAKAVFLCLIIMIITGIQLAFMKKKEVEM